MPMANQMTSLYQFSAGSENISNRQIAIPAIGTKEPSGARNGLSAFGFVFLMIRTALQTITKASSVPMFTRSARIVSGKNEARVLTNRPVRIVDFHGVRNFS